MDLETIVQLVQRRSKYESNLSLDSRSVFLVRFSSLTTRRSYEWPFSTDTFHMDIWDKRTLIDDTSLSIAKKKKEKKKTKT